MVEPGAFGEHYGYDILSVQAMRDCKQALLAKHTGGACIYGHKNEASNGVNVGRRLN